MRVCWSILLIEYLNLWLHQSTWVCFLSLMIYSQSIKWSCIYPLPDLQYVQIVILEAFVQTDLDLEEKTAWCAGLVNTDINESTIQLYVLPKYHSIVFWTPVLLPLFILHLHLATCLPDTYYPITCENLHGFVCIIPQNQSESAWVGPVRWRQSLTVFRSTDHILNENGDRRLRSAGNRP